MGWRAQRRRSVLVFSVVAGGLGLSQQSVAEPARSLAQAPHEAGSEVDRPSDAETEQAAARKGLAELRMRAQRIAEEADLARGDVALEAARRCGKAWTDVARASEPANLDGAEALLSAAECFERAHAINAAIAARRALLRDFPGSPSVGSSVKWLVRAERTFGRFADAAALAEDFARRFARDPATKELLREATTLRIAERATPRSTSSAIAMRAGSIGGSSPRSRSRRRCGGARASAARPWVCASSRSRSPSRRRASDRRAAAPRRRCSRSDDRSG